ncbi:MAG: hypothetical protein F7C35_00640 [Desulfurococcales archaeon]|nr:hypothetical protein [Desulfurococcales archaeon]
MSNPKGRRKRRADIEAESPDGEVGNGNGEVNVTGFLDELDFPDAFNTPYGVSWHGYDPFQLPRDEDEHLTDNLADGKEWRNFSDGRKGGVNRANIPPPTHNILHLNEITYQKKPRRYRKVDSVMYSKLGKNERKLKWAIDMTKHVLARLELGSHRGVTNTAYHLVYSYIEHKQKKGRKISNKEIMALVTAAVLEAIRLENVPIPRRLVVDTVLGLDFHTSPPDAEMLMRRTRTVLENMFAFGIMRRVLETHREYMGGQHHMLKRTLMFIRSLVSKLDLPPEDKKAVEKGAMMLVEKSVKNGKSLSGKYPEAIAAASIYIVARLLSFEINQKDIAKLAMISETNVRKAFRFLVEDQAIVVPLTPVNPVA